MKTAHDVKLLNGSKQEVSYTGVETATMPGTDGQDKVFTAGAPIDAMDISPDFSGGDMPLEAPEGYVVRSATIKKPEGAEQVIAKGQTLAGIVGAYVTPGTAKEITPDFSGGDQTVTAEGDERWSEVTVKKPETLVAENIAKDVEIAGIVGTYVGSGISGTGAHHVKVIDYDGKVLAEAYLDAGDVFTLPDDPSHERLIFEGWSSPEEIIDGAITIGNSDICIVPMYHTVSGATEFDIEMTRPAGLTFTFGNVISPSSIDWGDGTIDSTKQHSYGTPGKYTIKVYGIKSIASGSTTGGIVGSGSVGNNMYLIKKVFLAEGFSSIGSYAFLNCMDLISITIPSSLTRIYDYAFQGCYNLVCIAIPDKVNYLGKYLFSSCFSLSAFNIPKSLTYINNYIFSGYSRLTSITIPDSINSIYANAFYNCTNIKVYDFSKCTTVPKLASTNSITSPNMTCKILIPSALYATWKATTNWSNFASYMVPV